MQLNKRHFIIMSKHKRLTRLWQFFFTGWGLVMVAVLAAAPMFTKQILWTPIKTVNIQDIDANQFKITNAKFVGTDKEGNPFDIKAKIGYQKFGQPDIIYLESPNGVITRSTDKGKVVDNISAIRGTFNHKEKVLTLYNNVRVNSSDGNKILTD